MVGLRRTMVRGYESETILIPLERVARQERQFPREWIHAEASDVTPEFVEWARPLIGAVKPHVRV